MCAVRGGNQLRGDAKPVSGSPYAALQHRCDPQRLGNPADVGVLALERERRRPGNHLQSGNLRQRVDDLFGQPVAKVLVLGIATHIGEREHHDRRAAGSISSQGML